MTQKTFPIGFPVGKLKNKFLKLRLISSEIMMIKGLAIFLTVSLTGCGDNRSDAEKFGAAIAELHRQKNPFLEFQSVDSMIAWTNKNGVYPAASAARRPIRFPGVVEGWLPVMGLTLYLKSQSDKKVELDMKLTKKVKNTKFRKGDKYLFECQGELRSTQKEIRAYKCEVIN